MFFVSDSEGFNKVGMAVMNKWCYAVLSLMLCFGFALMIPAWSEGEACVAGASQATPKTEEASPEAKAAVAQYMAGPSVFIQNLGQWNAPEILFALDGTGANVGLTGHGPKFQLFRRVEGVRSDKDRSQ